LDLENPTNPMNNYAGKAQRDFFNRRASLPANLRAIAIPFSITLIDLKPVSG
jgi:hypothetical protein